MKLIIKKKIKMKTKHQINKINNYKPKLIKIAKN